MADVIKSLKTELKKNLFLPYFVMALLLTLGFCLMADAATGNDGKNYSVFQVILLSKNLRLTTDERFAWVVIWSKGFGRWLQLVVPLVR